MDTPAGIRCDFTVQSQFNDFDGVLHVAGLLPWRIKLVVDVGYGERSPRAQQRRNNGPRGLGLRSSGAAAGCDDRRNAELRRQLPVRGGRVLRRDRKSTRLNSTLLPHTPLFRSTVLVAWDYDHPVPRPDVTIGGMPSYDGNCQSGAGGCYAVRAGTGPMGDPPNRYVSLAPTFSGASGTASYIERAQDHPSRLQDNAVSSERQWFTDGRPLQPLMDISDAAISVSGQLYRVTSTTTDGDNLQRVGYNIYVVKTSATTLVAAGNCSAANPCPIWNDTALADSIVQQCTITLLAGTGTVYVSRISSGGLGATYTNGLSISADHCPVSAGAGFPSGSTALWPWGASSGAWAASG